MTGQHMGELMDDRVATPVQVRLGNTKDDDVLVRERLSTRPGRLVQDSILQVVGTGIDIEIDGIFRFEPGPCLIE